MSDFLKAKALKGVGSVSVVAKGLFKLLGQRFESLQVASELLKKATPKFTLKALVDEFLTCRSLRGTIFDRLSLRLYFIFVALHVLFLTFYLGLFSPAFYVLLLLIGLINLPLISKAKQSLVRFYHEGFNPFLHPLFLPKLKEILLKIYLKEEEITKERALLLENYLKDQENEEALYKYRDLGKNLQDKVNGQDQALNQQSFDDKKGKTSASANLQDKKDSLENSLSAEVLEGELERAYKSNCYLGEGFIWTKSDRENLNQVLEIDSEDLTRIKEMAKEQGSSLIHLLGAKRFQHLFMPCEQLTSHMVIFGSTGSGKSTLLLHLIAQAILRNEAVIIIDPKSDLAFLKKVPEICKATGRTSDYRLLDLYNTNISDPLNPLRMAGRDIEYGERLTSSLPKDGASSTFRSYSQSAIFAAVCMLRLENKEINLSEIASMVGDHNAYKVRLIRYFKLLALKLNNGRVDLFITRAFGGNEYAPVKKDESKEGLDTSQKDENKESAGNTQSQGGANPPSSDEKDSLGSNLLSSSAGSTGGESGTSAQEQGTEASHLLEEKSKARARKSTRSASSKTSKSSAKKESSERQKNPSAQVLSEFYHYLINKGFLEGPDYRIEQVLRIIALSTEYYNKVSRSCLTMLEKLSSDDLKGLFSRTGHMGSASSAIEENLVLQVSLRCLIDSDLGSEIGKLILDEIRSYAGRFAALKAQGKQKTHKKVNIFIDEASETLNESLVQLLNKSRSAGFAITLATQTSADLAKRSGNFETVQQILGNCNTLVSLKILDEGSTKVVSGALGRSTINAKSSSKGFSEGPLDIQYSGMKSFSEKEVDTIPAKLLNRLPPLEYVARLPSSTIVKGRVPYFEI